MAKCVGAMDPNVVKLGKIYIFPKLNCMIMRGNFVGKNDNFM
jgi:hypothetical protein